LICNTNSIQRLRDVHVSKAKEKEDGDDKLWTVTVHGIAERTSFDMPKGAPNSSAPATTPATVAKKKAVDAAAAA
jgi:hypothetical protein